MKFVGVVVDKSEATSRFVEKTKQRMTAVFFENPTIKLISAPTQDLVLFSYKPSKYINYALWAIVIANIVIDLTFYFCEWSFIFPLIVFCFSCIGFFFLTEKFVFYTMVMGLKKEGYSGSYKSISLTSIVEEYMNTK